MAQSYHVAFVESITQPRAEIHSRINYIPGFHPDAATHVLLRGDALK